MILVLNYDRYDYMTDYDFSSNHNILLIPKIIVHTVLWVSITNALLPSHGFPLRSNPREQ